MAAGLRVNFATFLGPLLFGLPAGATTLIISLGIITKPFNLVLIEAAVMLLTVQAMINRLAGLNYPCWARHQETTLNHEPTVNTL
jgi:hypothetical protein